MLRNDLEKIMQQNETTRASSAKSNKRVCATITTPWEKSTFRFHLSIPTHKTSSIIIKEKKKKKREQDQIECGVDAKQQQQDSSGFFSLFISRVITYKINCEMD